MKSGIDAILNRARKVRDDLALPEAAKSESRRDRRTAAPDDPGIVKFFVDANILEQEISSAVGGAGA